MERDQANTAAAQTVDSALTAPLPSTNQTHGAAPPSRPFSPEKDPRHGNVGRGGANHSDIHDGEDENNRRSTVGRDPNPLELPPEQQNQDRSKRTHDHLLHDDHPPVPLESLKAQKQPLLATNILAQQDQHSSDDQKQQQQQQQQLHRLASTKGSIEPPKVSNTNVAFPPPTAQSPFRLASLVDRVRMQQRQQEQKQHDIMHEHYQHNVEHPHHHLTLQEEQDHLRAAAEGRPAPGIQYASQREYASPNVIEGEAPKSAPLSQPLPHPHQQQHSRGWNALRRPSILRATQSSPPQLGESIEVVPRGAGAQQQHQQQGLPPDSSGRLARLLNKAGVHSAFHLNSAARAFTKTNRDHLFQHEYVNPGVLAIIGASVPALWFRRDNKKRRPPPVFFQVVKVAITDSEIEHGLSKQIIFRIELQYGDTKWVIRRTSYDFYKLHVNLLAKQFKNLPKFPSQFAYLAKTTLGTIVMRPEQRIAYMRETNLARRLAMQEYLVAVLRALNWTTSYDLYEFLEISAMSLTKDMGWKGKEGLLDSKVIDTSFAVCGFTGIKRWQKCWVLLRDSYLAFCPSVGSNEPSDVFIFDHNFYVQHKEKDMGFNLHHIEIGNTHRRIELKGDHNREMLEWMEHFNRMRQSSPWVRMHRFGSFAPEREDAKVRYYVDGKDYFHAVSDAILAAKTEIYICDWWLSPELYLRRPPEQNQEFRLDRLLKKKAMEGVMIYIVVYKEISLALTLDSAHTKTWLQSLHPNIQVQRHPDHLGVNSTQFWAHHEKICVIDCRLAFIGGLDLCFGRYDSRTHQLSDYHPSGGLTVWPGQDYSNPRIKDFVNVKDYNANLIEKKLLPRMPWHDVSIGVAGPPARDIARHFVQRWNFVKREKGMKKTRMRFLTPKGEYSSTRNETGWTGSQKVQVLRSSTLWSQGVDMERSIQNAYLSLIENAEHFIYIENQFFVTLATENGNPDIKNTIGIALFNRIMRAHQEQKKFRVIVVMPLMPAFEADVMSSEAGTLRKVMHFQYMSICRGGNSLLERLVANGVDPDQYIGFFGLRSFDRIKHGRFDAIVEAVRQAEAQNNPNATTTVDPSQSVIVDTNKSPHGPTLTDVGDEGQNVKNTTVAGDPIAIKRTPAARLPATSDLSKILLEPLPTAEEAERIKAIAEQRKQTEALQPWDESITKRAMSPAQKELGYVPEATEIAERNAEWTQTVHEEAAREQEEGHGLPESQTSANAKTTPDLLDQWSSKLRHALEGVRGFKEASERRMSRLHLSRHGSEFGEEDSDDSDSCEDAEGTIDDHERYGGMGVTSMGIPFFGGGGGSKDQRTDQRTAKDESETIIEPSPMPSERSIEPEQRPVQATSAATGTTAGEQEEQVPREESPALPPGHVVDDEVNDFVTEELYIHSKLMIVDDRIIICGSANINDRSQLGYRDSEIAMIIEDTEFVPSKMNGEPYQAGKLAHTLRTDLFKEHLGFLPHVDHDVVTKASVLPVDLDAPEKDPEEARQELIKKHSTRVTPHKLRDILARRKVVNADDDKTIEHAGDTNGHLHPSSSTTTDSSIEVSIAESNGKEKTIIDATDGGYIEVTLPDEDETRAMEEWHHDAHAEHIEKKKQAAHDPQCANEAVMDPLHDDFYEHLWKATARTNTELFREVFHCVPDDSVETWDDYKKFVPDPKKVLTGHVAMPGATVDTVKQKLQGISGHLVEFPTRFLAKENLMGGVVEGAVVPMEIFT
ncbi:hypothetical protein BGW42_006992 [Actinomortierella wolfii]|nr:hypothetical protein BGW42_006992 [Actinomortierella wolfii]